MQPVLMNNVRFAYKKNRPIFDSLDLSLSKGHIHGLLGKNGSGKTTLLKLISGLLFPTRGEILSLGVNPGKRSPHFLNNLSFLPEEFFLPPGTIQSFVKNRGDFYPKFSFSEFREHLLSFEIEDMHLKLQNLSHGMKKKVMIAFCLASNPDLLILDEPTNALDIPSKKQFRKMIASTATDDRCVIISSHQVRDLHSLIDNIVILDEHDIILNQTIDEICEKLAFKIIDSTESSPHHLYTEEVLKGKAIVEENLLGEETKLDIELLFNAVFANKNRIKEIFKTEQR